MKRSDFLRGIRHGIPIALGYLSVSFGFGIAAVKSGLPILTAVGISATNLTSAGQAAGIEIIAAGGSIIEMIIAQIIINLRYSLMGISLSQKLSPSFNGVHRAIAAFGITDEVFAVSSAQVIPLTPYYMYGMIMISFLGWTSGTFLGAFAGEILPISLTSAMGVVLYGMFIAIIVPPAKKSTKVLFTVILAAAISIILKVFVPVISGGFAIIISACVSALLSAAFFPIDDDSSKEETV